MFIPDQIIEQAVSTIITTRDFCGNERTAVYDLAAELGYKAESHKIYQIANFRANAAWNGFKKAAGVNPKYTW